MVGIRRCPGRVLALAAMVAIALLAAACSRGEKVPELGLAAPSGKLAPDFEITVYQGEDALGGKTVKLSSLRGKPLVLNFWAGLCPPCRAEMPDFQALSQLYQGRVLVVGVDIGPFVGLGSEADGRRLVQELRITYPTGTTRDQGVPVRYEVLGMPTTVFIKPNGTILRKWTGLLSSNQMADLVERLLRESGA